jgi:hypothetical protein
MRPKVKIGGLLIFTFGAGFAASGWSSTRTTRVPARLRYSRDLGSLIASGHSVSSR